MAGEIEALAIPLEREALGAVIALRDRLDAKVAEAVGAYAAEGRHELDGAVTMSAWLRQRARLDRAAAGGEAQRAAKLRELPVVREAFIGGAVSAGAVRVILANVPRRHLVRFAEQEAELVPLLAQLDPEDLRRAMAEWLARADALDPGPEPAEQPDRVYLNPTLGGGGVLHGNLSPELFELVRKALEQTRPREFDRPVPERNADGLAEALQHVLDCREGFRAGRQRPHITVTVPIDWLAGNPEAVGPRFADTGMPVPEAVWKALACDAAWSYLVHDGGAVLRYGRARRDWPADLASAIGIRDGGCRWPGCTAPPSWCDIHHITPWEQGGTTDVDNGVLLCRRHHHLLHSRVRWHLALEPDGTVVVTHPGGWTEQTRPRGLAPPRLPLPPP